MPSIFDPIKIGNLQLPNRIIMAPLTRCRASLGRIPNEIMREYYTQRASAGLILSEATAISAQGVGYRDTPGLWNGAQIDGWKKITDSVHNAGGRMFAQLWHVGKISHPAYLNGALPVSASAITPLGRVRLPDHQIAEFVTPRALELQEITNVIQDYYLAAQNAKLAGFDGVEIHGANSYLPDQFLRDGTNIRTDIYGGSVENRARFLLEATDAAISVFGSARVGVHLSPQNSAGSGAIDSNPGNLFEHVALELGKRQIAFIFVRESLASEQRYMPQIKKAFSGIVIGNESYTQEDAQRVLEANEADAISWGRLFIANPDLPKRLLQQSELNALVPSTIYAEGNTGYTDYPALLT